MDQRLSSPVCVTLVASTGLRLFLPTRQSIWVCHDSQSPHLPCLYQHLLTLCLWQIPALVFTMRITDSSAMGVKPVGTNFPRV